MTAEYLTNSSLCGILAQINIKGGERNDERNEQVEERWFCC